MRGLTNLAALGAIAAGRVSEGSIYDDSPLVVIYYENWAGWVRAYSPSHLEQNFLSRDMPVRNFVFNYAFFTWNPQDCSMVSVDNIDLAQGDKGGWTISDWSLDSIGESWEDSKAAGGHLPAFMLLKAKYPYIKLMPSVGGWSRSYTYHDCIINKMDHMVDSLVDHVTVWGWDGVDFDWEYPACDGAPCGCQGEAVCLPETGFSNVAGKGDYDRYKTFVKKVRAAFNDLEDKLGRRLYITAAVGMNPKIIEGNNDIWSDPAPYEWICDEDDFDWVNMMTYDFYGPWAPLTGPLAPLYPNPNVEGDQMSIADSVERILKRCKSPHKLTMGLATYGKTWQNVPKTGDVPGLWQEASSNGSTITAGGTWEMGTVSYFDIKKNILPKCERTWDDVSKTPTLYCSSLPNHPDVPYDPNVGPVPRGQSNVFITYEDGESWKEKMSYARSKGLAGAIVWAASDTGNGQSYAPDSTADLYEGLFEGWFGKKVELPKTSKLSASPGSIARWPEYPCPLAVQWVTGTTPVDMSLCSGKTYSPDKKYLAVPQVSGGNTVGKDKVLIHPLGGNNEGGDETGDDSTTPPAVKPSTAPTTPAPTKTTTPKPFVTTTTQKGDGECTCTCPSPIDTTSTTSTTSTVPQNETSPDSNDASTGGSDSGSGSGEEDGAAIVTGCQSKISSQPQWEAACKDGCKSYYSSDWCPGMTSADDLASCVIHWLTYCTLA